MNKYSSQKLMMICRYVLSLMICIALYGTINVLAGTTPSQATPIVFGQEVDCRSTGSNDEKQYFTFSTDSSNSYYTMVLRNSNGHCIHFHVYDGPDSSYPEVYKNVYMSSIGIETDSVALQPNKTYTIVVLCNGSGADFHFKVNKVLDDYSGSFSTATPIPIGGSIEGNIEVNGVKDCDLFSFQTTGNNSYYVISCAATGKSGSYMALYNGSDESYKKDSKLAWSGDTVTMIEKLDRNTVYYLKTYSYDDKQTSYRISINEVVDNAGDDFKDANAVKTDKNINGTFEVEGDKDFFKFTTASNKTAYQLYFRNKSTKAMHITLYYRDDIASRVENVNNIYINPATSNYVLLNLKKKTTYYFKVDECYGNDASYTVAFNSCSKKIKKDNPGSFKAVFYNGLFFGKRAYLTWKNKVPYSGVQIYRSTNPKSGFKKIKTLASDSTSYYDSKVKKKTTYYYKMRYYVKDNKKTYYGKWTSVKKVKIS